MIVVGLFKLSIILLMIWIMRSFVIVSQVIWLYSAFLRLFYLCSSVWATFINLSFHRLFLVPPFYYWAHPLKFSIFFFFNFRHCIIQSKVSIWLYFDILLLAEIFFFFICFLFVVAPQSIFMMALKPLSDYFNVSVILVWHLLIVFIHSVWVLILFGMTFKK